MVSSCTMGAVFTDDGLIIFKNRDLVVAPDQAENPLPYVEEGETYRYIKFGTGKTGVWAGINECGLGVVGADGNGLLNVSGEEYGGGHLTWEAYERALATAGTIDEAYPAIIECYERDCIGGTGDIVLIADINQAVILEYARPGEWGIQFCRRRPLQKPYDPPYAVRTNFFVTLSQYCPRPETSPVHLSSEARYKRAVALLSKTTHRTTANDIKALCRDHGSGYTAFSICRHGGDDEYKTVCSAILVAGASGVMAYYVINGFPCEEEYELITLGATLPDGFGVDDMKDRLEISEEEHQEIGTTLKRMERQFFDKLDELDV